MDEEYKIILNGIKDELCSEGCTHENTFENTIVSIGVKSVWVPMVISMKYENIIFLVTIESGKFLLLHGIKLYYINMQSDIIAEMIRIAESLNRLCQNTKTDYIPADYVVKNGKISERYYLIKNVSS